MTTGQWEGRQPRACGDHRTTGSRAWCYDCHEWCYPDGDKFAYGNCKGCRLSVLEATIEQLRAEQRESAAAYLAMQTTSEATHRAEYDTLHRLAEGLATALRQAGYSYHVVGHANSESCAHREPEWRDCKNGRCPQLSAALAAWEQHEKGVANASQTPRT